MQRSGVKGEKRDLVDGDRRVGRQDQEPKRAKDQAAAGVRDQKEYSCTDKKMFADDEGGFPLFQELPDEWIELACAELDMSEGEEGIEEVKCDDRERDDYDTGGQRPGSGMRQPNCGRVRGRRDRSADVHEHALEQLACQNALESTD